MLTDFFDVTLACDDQQIQAHKFISILVDLTVDGPTPRANSTWYCRCSKCEPMEREEESVCCQEVRMNPELLLGKSRLVLLVYISKIFFLECAISFGLANLLGLSILSHSYRI